MLSCLGGAKRLKTKMFDLLAERLSCFTLFSPSFDSRASPYICMSFGLVLGSCAALSDSRDEFLWFCDFKMQF